MIRPAAVVLLLALPIAASAKPVDFDRAVKPILATHCWKCHGAEKQKGGLRLDTRRDALAGGNSGAVLTVGKSVESKLAHAVAGTDPETKMPPEGQKPLTKEQVATLKAWIDEGLHFPEQVAPAPATTAKSSHWSFQPIRRPPVPTVEGATHPIDAFVRDRLRKERIRPSDEADKRTLIRRLHFDLIGLPPTPKEVEDFVNDASPTAYEKLVDRLLASPHYGERWGRHWLDVARYADSDGYEKDTGRPFAWRYREYVIQALNRDLPFDKFTIEQLAGDLLPNATHEQKIATGFHRNTLTNKEGGVDPEEFRVAAVVDRVATTGKVWLGLSVGCAQCHDHKYDPISQREFYQFFAFFNSDREADLAIPLPGEEEKLKQQQAAFDKKLAELKAAVAEVKEKKLPADELKKRQAAVTAHQKTAPSATKAMTLALGPTKPTHVMIRGDFLRKGVEVKPGTLGALPALQNPQSRLDLAKWLCAPDNPLTARVTANWIWSKYFGRGMVATLDDFGTQGEKPSHPELLDWLASELQDSTACGWSLKKFHKRIVTAETYQQVSTARPDLLDRDPLNVLLARQQRLRLDAEIVRDNALSVSGLLAKTVGGPSVRPPQPSGVSDLTYAGSAKWVETTGPDRYKRGMYVWFQRTSPYPMLMAFDEPDSNVCAVRRDRSNTPLQALMLLNDTVFVEASQALAKRLLLEAKDEPLCHKVEHLFHLTLGRDPESKELHRLLKLFTDSKQLLAKSPDEAKKLLGTHKPAGVDESVAAAWVVVCRAVMNLDEFVTRE